MLRRNRFWTTVWAIGIVLVAGCRTSPRPKLWAQESHIAADGRRLPGSDPALDNLAEAHAHYAAGVIYEVDEQPEAALKEYSLAALKDPDNEPLVLEVSHRLLQNKQTESALELLSRAAARPNVSGAVLARLGFVYSQLGKFDQAAAVSRAAIKKGPGSLVGYQNLCLNYLQNKQPQEALKVLDEAGRQPKVDAEFLVGLAELYAHLGLQVPAQRKTAHGGHVWGRIAGTVQLERDVLELVRRINGELPLVDRAVGHVEARPVLVAIRVVAPADSPELRNVSHQQTEHVIERSILKHQDDDVLDARVRRPAASLRPH